MGCKDHNYRTAHIVFAVLLRPDAPLVKLHRVPPRDVAMPDDGSDDEDGDVGVGGVGVSDGDDGGFDEPAGAPDPMDG